MLRTLRENASSWMIQAVFVLVVLVFIFFGITPSNPNTNMRPAAMVNGQRVTDGEYQQALRSRMQIYQQLNQPLTPELEEQLRENVLNDLIDRVLLAEEANKRGYLVSDDEIVREIRNEPTFQDENGTFSEKIYLDFLKRNGLARYAYERDARERLQLQRMSMLVQRIVSVSPSEIDEAFKKRNNKINLEFVRFSSLRFQSKVDTSDVVIDAYLKDNAQAVQERYNERKDTEFTRQRQATASHILLKTAPEDTEQSKAALRARLEKIKKELDAGADFADLARKYSEDPGSAVQGGSLGTFTADRMVKPFSDAAFALQPGGISGIVETNFGYHVIKTFAIIEGGTDAFEDVKRTIAKDIIAEEKAPELARAEAETLRARFEAGEDISAELTAAGLRVEETGEFTGDVERIPRIGDAPGILTWALGTTSIGQGMGRLGESGSDLFLVRVKARSTGDAILDETTRQEISRELLGKKRSDWDTAYRESLRQEAKIRRRI